MIYGGYYPPTAYGESPVYGATTSGPVFVLKYRTKRHREPPDLLQASPMQTLIIGLGFGNSHNATPLLVRTRQ
ncbi:hypothetical protein HBI56_042940 [Parastagonospora nodorum]|nr:hypothetical protein HBH54_084270 [Parastagonospora nodorum]KAH4004982.1 hypothetical protein HBI10_046240 [Parastagonospora nodorum]KAH4031166.1 hypothetical protein HBI13_029690 [Parastagonospora nodorum]KAH4143492.1 hypothetical protein HBH45_039280 [Parastagonospora nodorum]KAH4146767.1 hypothetical protein HBH44_236540 [Parastagonospora nodorum]